MRYNNKYFNFILDTSEYYDFELVEDTESNIISDGHFITDDLVIDIDYAENYRVGCCGKSFQLSSSVKWDDATIEDFSLPYITTTGLDNYFISESGAYDDGVINTGITYTISSGDTFTFYPVSGWTTNLSYEINVTNPNFAQLNGGFYQGFFKLYDYPFELMPSRMRKGWTVDMIIKFPSERTGTGTTLSDVFPDNEGFIFYFGTRAEDKYWNGFTTGTPSETSILFNWSGLTITDERYQTYVYPSTNAGLGGVDINYYNPTDNAGVRDYLYYQTSNEGYGFYPATNDGNVYGGFKIGYAYGGGSSQSMITGDTSQLTYSPLYTHGDDFITSGGTSYAGYYHYTDHQPYASRYYDDNTQPLYVKYPFKSITDNAFGVRIRPDGRIGYRCLKLGNICQTGTTVTVTNGITGTTTPNYKIEEGYSVDPIWNAYNTGYCNVSIVYERYVEINECDLQYNDYRKGTLTIYVNARPVLKVDNFEEIIPHELDGQKELQAGVPFNISWGGGTQGLYESVTFGGIDTADRNLLLQQLFAGSWYGSLSQFKMYIKPLHFTEILHNFKIYKNQFGLHGSFGGRRIFVTKYVEQETTPEEPETPVIGGEYGGGIVINIDGDHGLIITSTDVGYLIWGCDGEPNIAGISADYGSGPNNTELIVNNCSQTDIAAKTCYNLSYGGYDDWYLPSQDELWFLYENRDQSSLNLAETNNIYWSSSQSHIDGLAVAIDLEHGVYQHIGKATSRRVRAVRSF